MVKAINIVQATKPFIKFPDPLPLMSANVLTLGFSHQKEENDFLLGLRLIYDMKDMMDGTIHPVSVYEAYYRIITDGKITAEEIYPVCQQCVHGLKMWIDLHLRPYKIRPTDIECPELSHLQKDLQIEADWFEVN